MTRPPAFVHLHLHSEFSLAEGIVRIKPLAQSCAVHNQPAVALTDISNLYGLVKFYRTCMAQGVKPIIGCDVWVNRNEKQERLTLLCQNNQGYKNLSVLLTEAYLGHSGKNRVALSWQSLATKNAGLLCLLDEHHGPLAQHLSDENTDHSGLLIEPYMQIFAARLYFSISRIGWPNEARYIERAVSLSAATGIPLVATNRVVFLTHEDFGAHEIRVCINDGRVLEDPRRSRNYTDQQYLKSTEQMVELFRDIPCAITNTQRIAQRCNLFLNFSEDHLPDFPGATQGTEAELLRRNAEAGLAKRLGLKQLRDDQGNYTVQKKYIDRMHMELGVIEQMGYPGYFLIVADFIEWSRKNDIPVGPGRGSGAGSLVAWATGITEIDPLPYGLIFERFLNPERVSLPDFDIDFCVDGRDRVIEYVAARYGESQVAQVITFGTMAAKAVVRDVGRVMGFPYGFVDQIAKLIPFEVGMTLSKALRQEELLKARYGEEDDVQELIDAALQLEGIARNVGKHAGGVVIAPEPLTEYTPLYTDHHLSQAITQLDKDDLEAIGLVKFDFLGLRTLTILNNAIKMVNVTRAATEQPPIDLHSIPLDDAATYRFVQLGRTTAIFQLESRGMRELIIKANPETFEDLVALIAMFRPGPLQSGMVDDFVNRKAGREAVKYLHPELEPILAPTYGVILYQEQVMKIAQSLAGYTLGGADLLRKAMGKKLPEEMARQRQTFVDGAVSRGIDKKIAESIFDLMDKFAGYGFNKSHSAAYALVSYHTAWLKTHYPAAFMAATLSADMDNTDKVVTLLADCSDLELEVLPPDINSGEYAFRPIDAARISYGLGAIKGVGQAVIEGIVGEREANGQYLSLFDLCRRVDIKKVNKRVLEAVIKSGALDSIDPNRAALMANIPAATQAADQIQQNERAGQFDLFGTKEQPMEEFAMRDVEPWSEEQRLRTEKETLGLYLTGHPYAQFQQELAAISDSEAPASDLSIPRNGIFAGILIAIRVLKTKRGKMAFVTLDNAVHRVEVSLFSDKYAENLDKIVKDRLLIVVGEFSTDEYTGGCRMHADKIFDLAELRSECLECLEVAFAEGDDTAQSLTELHAVLNPYRGGSVAIRIRYSKATGEEGLLTLGSSWSIKPAGEALNTLQEIAGQEKLTFHYRSGALQKYHSQRSGYQSRERSRD